jgi:UDP-galactopyranose mutase
MEMHSGTSTMQKYPLDEGEPNYPAPSSDSPQIYKRYEELARSEKTSVLWAGWRNTVTTLWTRS